MTAFLSVLAVLIVLVGGINISNYVHVVNDSDKVLRLLADNDGVFPDRMMHEGGELGQPVPPEARRGERIDSPELAFETRFFTVRYDADGNVIFTDVERVSAVSDDMASELSERALSEGTSSGFIGDYRYIITDGRDEGTLVITCDRGASLANFRSFRNISLILSVLCLLILGTIIYFISGKAVKPVLEANEKQKRFISDAGHEIKTPLAIIRADADVLGMEIGEDNEWLSDMIRQTERLTELTNNLITLSRMEEGGSTLVMEETDLSQLASDVADSVVKAPAMLQNKKFTADIEDGVRIVCDRKTVYELMSILLDNAVKYCPSGKEIGFSLKPSGKKALISVTNDTENPMDEETVAHLFDRFYRADSSRNSESGGFGIGLSVAKAIAEAHHGQISAASEDGKITFTAVL
ncbi:MAG: HAMP domain-containing histidine kinase [Lachnospiraceae bacterium]|nr:HAMP domain-containing histidine kinase [Lachnospiraceae bacterium]